LVKLRSCALVATRSPAKLTATRGCHQDGRRAGGQVARRDARAGGGAVGRGHFATGWQKHIICGSISTLASRHSFVVTRDVACEN
jgi:hypothetical protein